MIRNQWYAVLDSKEVKKGKITGVTRMGEKLAFWRDEQGKTVCMVDLCPHIGARLSQGKLVDGHIACPFHGFEYNPSGQCVYLPAYGRKGIIPKSLKTATYPVYEAHNFIYIYWGHPETEPEPPQFFDSIDESKMSYGTFKQGWTVQYSRVVENQLDVTHLPFVHYNTIGRGGRTVVDGPVTRLTGDLLELWVYNRHDDGTPPRKAEDMPNPDRRPFLQFRFPNVWQNWITDENRIVVAFVPVDDENTIMYGRYYQSFVRLPLLRNLVNWIGVVFSIYIANQDRTIVNNQYPKHSELKGFGEKIMQSDHALLVYRMHRDELKEKNNPKQ
jgi:phenylpropionate dioxygenase-like ring-hydroxylating dioxygenase large terminal subunit